MTRALFERLCRGVALVSLATALWMSLRGDAAGEQTSRSTPLTLTDTVLADTSTAAVAMLRPVLLRPAADTIQLTLRAIPALPLRAALGALQAARAPLVWQDSTGARGIAVSASRASTPGAPLFVKASGSGASPLVVRDAGGLLDSLTTGARHLSWELRSATSPISVRQGFTVARIVVPDSGDSKRVLVVAQPGWEGKFVVAALEESGWRVDGRMRVSPTGAVTIGAPQPLQLDRYAAVVVLDSMAVDAAALQTFVSRGGGLVLGGDALQIASLASLRPARAVALRGAIAGGLLTDDPRRGLEAWELDLATGAVILADDPSEHGHREPALVARRIGSGRVVAMAYRESWRWRMQGSDNGAEQHRRWWQSALTAAVPAVASAPDSGSASTRGSLDALPGDAAPYADFVARLGPAEAFVALQPVGTTTKITSAGDERGVQSDISRILSAPALLLITLLALLGEWISRRLRGQR